ncbi:hypothetical protein JL720_3957 [Aureococcus anophagefferens]|nr:hypothetical protein JL720_3957 [Aureococcus anophagefferens]
MASMRSMRLHLGLWLLAVAARCESNHSVIVVAGFSHTGTHLVSHALEALGLGSQARSARPVSCASSLVIYPGFEALFDDVVAILDHDWRFAASSASSCRRSSSWTGSSGTRAARRSRPGRPARRRGAAAPSTGRRGSTSCPCPGALSILAVGPGIGDMPPGTVRESLWARADALFRSQVLAHAYFDADRDQHVVLHTSTSAPVTVWRDHAAHGRRRVLLPHLEGFLGDMRKGVVDVGPRTVVVPYFVEPNGLLDAAADGGPRAVAVFLRAYEETLRTHVDTMRRMRNATFCLVPAGYTSSSRRFYESLAAGCVPVILSRHFPLPFGPSSARGDQRRGDAVLRHAAHKVGELPAFLRALSGARVAAMRRAGAAALARVSYGNEAGEGATRFDQLTHLVAPTTSQRLLPWDWPAAGSYLASCDGAGPASCEADKRTVAPHVKGCQITVASFRLANPADLIYVITPRDDMVDPVIQRIAAKDASWRIVAVGDGPVEHVMVADGSDVFFQRDPFDLSRRYGAAELLFFGDRGDRFPEGERYFRQRLNECADDAEGAALLDAVQDAFGGVTRTAASSSAADEPC